MQANRTPAILAGSEGFTLIEALVAMFILVVAILAMYTMHVTSIRHNAGANSLTVASTWASDRIEQLLLCKYEDPEMIDRINKGVAGLDKVGAAADGQATSPDGRYIISWNVVDSLIPNPADPDASTVKTVRVIVQHATFGMGKQVAFTYYKQRVY